MEPLTDKGDYMSDNGNGDLKKVEVNEEELKKNFEEQLQKNLQAFKDFIIPGTILVVRLNEQGTPQWTTSLEPAHLNVLLDRMKFCIVNPKPNLIQKPKGNIIADLKGAFGKKRF